MTEAAPRNETLSGTFVLKNVTLVQRPELGLNWRRLYNGRAHGT